MTLAIILGFLTKKSKQVEPCIAKTVAALHPRADGPKGDPLSCYQVWLSLPHIPNTYTLIWNMQETLTLSFDSSWWVRYPFQLQKKLINGTSLSSNIYWTEYRISSYLWSLIPPAPSKLGSVQMLKGGTAQPFGCLSQRGRNFHCHECLCQIIVSPEIPRT